MQPLSLAAMNDLSYGIIPVRFKGDVCELMLLQHRLGHWTFPKGHPEAGETPQQTAERELVEETGLAVVRYLSNSPFTEEYSFTSQQGIRVQKTATYFLAEVHGDIQLQFEEVAHYRWVELLEAADAMSFPEGRKLCYQVVHWMNSNL